MKSILRIGLIAALMLLSLACSRIMEDEPVMPQYLPDGTPVTLYIPFGSSEMVELQVGTKAESPATDESRVHDLYVMIFDNTTQNGSPKKIYGRYFSYEHLASDLGSLDLNPNEGWWVENKTLSGVSPAVATTAGAVKVSTTVCSNALLVVLANVTNAVSSMSDNPDLDDIAYLNGIGTLDELRSTKITLEQDVVNRKDLFLMMGTMGKIGPEDTEHSTLNTHDMIWGTTPKNYSSTYKLSLKTLDAKVKFMVRCNRDNIDAERAVYWSVCSTPDKCYLFSDYNDGAVPDDAVFFDSESAYFEGTESADEVGYSDWYVFTFYTLENRQEKKKHASSYHDREKQIKTDTGISGYEWWTKEGEVKENHTGNYVTNGKWEYANDLATYVKFDMVLTLNSSGIFAATGETVNNALTTDTIYSIHLGDFGTSESQVANAFDDYNTLRSHFYTYKITIDNSGSVYAEVENDNERQPGQEGYLLLTNDEIVNADAHYEYHSVSFGYSEDWDPSIFSWYVKTPFGQGEPRKTTETVGGRTYPLYSAEGLDYKWVMFGVNDPDSEDPTKYSKKRLKYPGISKYDASWKPSSGQPAPKLMDINQLIEYLFDQKVRKENHESNAFLSDTIRVTIFIDEYYYEKNPLDNNPSAEADPDLWRRFVNAEPREMHILSDARKSRDKKSDVILSSHSIIQQSIQTIYNTYAPGLRSLWGTEHKDEIKEKVPAGWHYWPDPNDYAERSGSDNDLGRENGRVNSAYIWNLCNNSGGAEDNEQLWDTYMDFNVQNNTPELKAKYQGMAFSCLTRNRDNDGNGKIDRNEVRWYLAATRQLIGMWVGNESLSLGARLYQPAEGQWRAHVVSSTKKLVCWAEEGAGATDLSHDWAGPNSTYATWASQDAAAAGESVRCLRNIGTYDGSSGITDISYAPYNQEIDKYFTIEKEGSGFDETTTFYFDRLDTKSIREYSEGELPYHPQTSPNNRVYVKMTAQSQASQVDEFPVILSAAFNPLITASGTNPYCPAGWRLPNQTEYLLMSLYMSKDYFSQDAEGNAYTGTEIAMPSRTYYDRGLYGDLRQESGPWSSEKNKVGFAYNTSGKKIFCTWGNRASDHEVRRTRCVRDDKMTGAISGDLLLNDNVVYPQDRTKIIFNFSSVASAFTYASLKLCYNTHNGNYRELDIPLDKMPTGLQFRDTLNVSLPPLSELGLNVEDFPVSMTLQAQVRNLAGQTETKNVPITMDNPLTGTLTPDEYFYPNDEQGGSFTYSFSTESPNYELSSISFKLRYTDQNSTLRERTLSTVSISGRTYSGGGVVNVPTLSELGLDTYGANLNHPMTIEATVTSANGLTYTETSNVTLVSHLTGSSFQFPTAYDDVNGIPVNVTVQSVNNRASVSSTTFYWKREGDASYSLGPSISGTLNTNVKDITGEDLSETNKGKFYFYFTAACSDGTSITSDVWSMDILYYGKCWNPGPWDSNSTNSQIKNKWPVESISNLDFSRGDFIDTYIDVSNCVYIFKDGTSNNDIGMDNLITIGTSADLNWKNGDLYFYYPAHHPAEAPTEDRMQLSIKDNNSTVTRLRPYDLNGFLTIRLSKDLLLVNGSELDYSAVVSGNNSTNASNAETRSRATIENITNQSTVKIGSVEGLYHRSRATYNYVRVVRKVEP